MPDPELLLLDEPAAGLDLGAREALLEALERLAGEPRPAAVALVTHHVEEIPIGFDRALLLRAGQVVAAGPIERTLSDRSLSETFEQSLRLGAVDGRFHARRGPDAGPSRGEAPRRAEPARAAASLAGRSPTA